MPLLLKGGLIEAVGISFIFMFFIGLGIFILIFMELITIALRIGNVVKELRLIKDILKHQKKSE